MLQRNASARAPRTGLGSKTPLGHRPTLAGSEVARDKRAPPFDGRPAPPRGGCKRSLVFAGTSPLGTALVLSETPPVDATVALGHALRGNRPEPPQPSIRGALPNPEAGITWRFG